MVQSDAHTTGDRVAGLIHARNILEIDHEIFSMVILSLPLIHEGQLSVVSF